MRKQSIETSWTPFVTWMRMTSIACTMNFQIGLPKQTNIASQPWWRVYSNFETISWATKDIMNIATGAILENDEEEFLMNWISLGKAARNKFYESHLTEKDIRLLETIPKTRKSPNKNIEKKEHDWLKKHLNFWLCALARFRS